MEKRLTGTGVSGKIGIGKAFLYAPLDLHAEQSAIKPENAAREISLWESAKLAAAAELEQLIESMASQPDKAKIFAAHKEILDDEEIDDMVREGILKQNYTVQSAVQSSYEEFIGILSRAKNAVIAERTADLKDVRARLLRIFTGGAKSDLSSLAEPVVIVAQDLLPSDTATMDRKNVLGIITQIGGATSHSAILAKSYRIPAVLGAAGAMSEIENGMQVIVDGKTGEVIISPDVQTIEIYDERSKAAAELEKKQLECLDKPCVLKSGERVQIGINIGGAKATEGFDVCDFAGLLRTEFLYMDCDHLPTEDEQFAACKAILQGMNGKPVTLRTLDIGGDKQLKYMKLPKENNPFLGRRAVRLCFDYPDIFLTQLRAAYRASVFGKLQIMFPMISSVDDWQKAKGFALQAQKQLDAEGIAYDKSVKLGIMIEIPSIAMIADIMAREVDFASIGTNDLCQYLCAADRMEPGVKAYYQSFSPAFIRILSRIIDAFNKENKELSMCGELAGDADAAALLAGLGLRKFSMSPACMGGVKLALSQITLADAKALSQKAQQCYTQAQVLEVINNKT